MYRLPASIWLVLLGATLCHAIDSRPNVLLIRSNDQALTDEDFMGHLQIRTPHLNHLASEGLPPAHGSVPSSLCLPRRCAVSIGWMTRPLPGESKFREKSKRTICRPREPNSKSQRSLADRIPLEADSSESFKSRPHQKNNLASIHPDHVKQLRS